MGSVHDAEDSGLGRPLRRGQAWRARWATTSEMLIGICTLVYFLDGVIHSILGPLAPEVSQSLTLTKAQLGPIFSANLVGQCIGLVLLPLLGNRTGQRAIVIMALVGFGLAQC